MVCGNNKSKVINISLGGEKLKQVREFCYPGSAVTEDDSQRETFTVKRGALVIRTYVWHKKDVTISAGEKSRL